MNGVPASDVRAFVALELDAPLREAIRELQVRLRPRLGQVRLVRAENLHLTLRFLGATSAAQVARLQPMLAAAAAECPPAEALVRGVGTFQGRGGPRVLWLALELPQSVLALQAASEQAAVAVGFAAEARPFTPHLTLGRWRERASRPELPAIELGSARLDTVTLFRSELQSGGAVYTPLARFALGRA